MIYDTFDAQKSQINKCLLENSNIILYLRSRTKAEAPPPPLQIPEQPIFAPR